MTAARQLAGSVRAPLDFAGVYSEHVAFVFRALVRLGVARADAPDAAQQVFLVVHRRLDSFDGSSAVKTWLFGICMRVASDHRSRAHVRREVPTATLPETESPPSQLERVEQSQARAWLARLLNGLDENKRAVFVLYELEEWTMPEVAAALEVPLQTAYSRYHAARRDLETAAKAELRPGDAP